MPRKILTINIKTIDDKNHVKYWKKEDIDLDSIKFKIDQKTEPKPKKEPKKESKKDSKKETKKE